ncbi:MAG: lysophospholipid acyltransferase family protein [Thermoanaerobaculia bacterium]
MPKQRSRLRNRTEQLGFELALALLRGLSLPRAEAFGRRAGGLFRRVAGRRRELARRNLTRAFPEMSSAEVDELSQRVFAHFGGVAAELLWSLGETQEALLSRVEIEGEERARAAMAAGRGLFFLTAHLGNWEIGALVTASLGLPLTVVVRPLDNPYLEERLKSFRERSGNSVLPKADAAREILRALRRGGAVGILTDQHAHPPDAVVSTFFGRPASTTSSLARLADRTEALILPTFGIRTAPGRYRLIFGEPLDVRTLSPEERTVPALTARVNAISEAIIRRHPEQWLWLHNRWRLD